MLKSAHVGCLPNLHTGKLSGSDQGMMMAFSDFLEDNFRDHETEKDYIDLNRNRDFLLEDKKYDFVVLHYLFRGTDKYRDSRGEFATSPCQTPYVWRQRLVNSGAKMIFAFGSTTEISGMYLLPIPGYRPYVIDAEDDYGGMVIFQKEDNLRIEDLMKISQWKRDKYVIPQR